ncbi:MAG: hypothetical protein KIT79_15310 [Deltaproteobacteria bacterium]|nr:hypothetical protein [Deltaproteobacteria bacterium]
MAEWKNKRTGDVELVPRGVTPGFDTNPGKLRVESAYRLLTDKLEGAPAMIAQVAIRDVVNGRLFDDWFHSEFPKGEFPVLRLSDEAAQAIGARHRVAAINSGISWKQREKHPELKIEDYRILPELGEHPDFIVRQKATDGKGERVAVIRSSGKTYMAVVRAEKSGQATFVVSFRRSRDIDVQRLLRDGTVLYRKQGG